MKIPNAVLGSLRMVTGLTLAAGLGCATHQSVLPDPHVSAAVPAECAVPAQAPGSLENAQAPALPVNAQATPVLPVRVEHDPDYCPPCGRG